MITRPYAIFATLLFAAVAAPSVPADDEASPTQTDFDRLTQLQIFLDNANFGPGKIDGRWGEFTRKSLTRYLRANGRNVPEFTEEIPADFPADATSVEPIFIDYAVQQTDLDSLGTAPSEPAEQAEQDAMPYTSLSELIGEKYHVDRDDLAKLNEGTAIDDAEANDKIRVPNVARPFSLADVEKRAKEQKEADEQEPKADENDAHDIPPGPNNSVGIVWMALDIKGIGLHGTAKPDTIGRTSSHGCIRLSNWDAAKLSQMIEPGIRVHIE